MNCDDSPLASWSANHNKIQTRIGKWLGGEEVIVRGRRLFAELLPNLTYMQLHVLNITGRQIDLKLSTWLEKSQFMVSYPDLRIWCNQIAALAGNAQTSPVAAASAACLAADSRAYGSSQTQLIAMTTLLQLRQQHQAGVPLAELVQAFPIKHGFPAIMGFARPANKLDERLHPIRELTQELGFQAGAHQIFADQLATYLQLNFHTDINIAGFMAAFFLDQGFAPEEIYRLRTTAVLSGAMACYGDQYTNQEGHFLPQRCDDTRYGGPPPRSIAPQLTAEKNHPTKLNTY